VRKWREKPHTALFEVMRKMTNREFKSLFRLSRESFSKLLKKVEAKLKKNVHFAKLSSKSSIYSPTTKLAATLRWLAGGSHHDIIAFFGLSSSYFFRQNYFLWEIFRCSLCRAWIGVLFRWKLVERNGRGFFFSIFRLGFFSILRWLGL
jgi:hypothetical protein